MYNESYDQWKERRQNEILMRYSHLNLSFDELYSQHMTPEEKSEFMSAQDFISSVSGLEKNYKGKVIKYDEHLEKKAKDFVDQQKKNPISKARLDHVAQYSAKYAKLVNESPDQKKMRFNRKEIREKNLIKLDGAKFNLFFDKYLKGRFHDRQFDLDQYNKTVIAKLLMYYVRDERLEQQEHVSRPWSLDKGICLFGPIGTGKTSIMTAFSEFTNDMNLPTKFEVVDFGNTKTLCTKRGNEYIHKFRGRDFCHDELKAELVKSFGNEISPCDYLITQSYKRYENASNPTHYTTNETPERLEKILDDRVFSRLKASCNFICLGGYNRRPKKH